MRKIFPHLNGAFVPQASSFPLPVWASALMLAFLLLAATREFAAQSINDQLPARVVAPLLPQVDINRATLAQLMRIHGITRSYAERIIDARPYSNKGQLQTKGILPPQVYQSAKDRLVAHHIHH